MGTEICAGSIRLRIARVSKGIAMACETSRSELTGDRPGSETTFNSSGDLSHLLECLDADSLKAFAQAQQALEQMANVWQPSGFTPAVQPSKTDPWKAELRYRALVEKIPAVTFVAALDDTVQEFYVSPQIESLLGFSQEEWVENPFLWFRQLHPEDRDRWVTEFASTCALGTQFRSDYRLLARDGRVVWVHGECNVVHDESGRPIFFQGIAFDITATRKAEEILRQTAEQLEERVRERTAELAQSEGRLQAIVETAVDAIITIDERGHISSFNSAATRMFGFTPDEIRGQNISMLMPSPYREEHDGYMRNYQRTGIKKIIGIGREATGQRKDGSLFPVEVAVSETALGERRIYTGIVRDISERKAAEAKLESAHRKLLDASRHAGMAEIATGVLHNVGNVLNSVNVSSSLLLEGVRKSGVGYVSRVVELLSKRESDLGVFITTDPVGSKIPSFLAQLAKSLESDRSAWMSEISQLQQSVDHIKEIVSTQQSYARSGGLLESLVASELLDDALRLQNSAIGRHRVEVVKEIDTVPLVRADRHKVLQILVNLISNAKQAMADCSEKRLTLKIEDSEDFVRISVSDTGCGIEPQNMTSIFGHGFTTKKDGHGFGLHSSALAAKELGGSVVVHSDGPGKGAKFTLELPHAKSSLSVAIGP